MIDLHFKNVISGIVASVKRKAGRSALSDSPTLKLQSGPSNSPKVKLQSPPAPTLQQQLSEAKAECDEARESVRCLLTLAGLPVDGLQRYTHAEIIQRFNSRASAAALDVVASMGIPAKDVPPQSSVVGGSFKDRMADYNSIRDPNERAAYYSKYLAPQFDGTTPARIVDKS
jgi:hypothetical protein